MPEEWVHDESTLPCLFPRIAFRDIARATDRRTIIPALVPPETVLTNKAPYFLWPRGDERDEAYLLGVMASIPFDWYARRFVEIGVNYHILNAIPVPRPGRNAELRNRVVELAGRLAAVDERYADWADAVGVNCGEIDEERKQERIDELDALVSHLYGLKREDVTVLFETFHDGWDHEGRMERVLNHYDRIDE
jgi:phenylpyruvate tautomerase PptA (4-oxalocrotonate tautomerase family)